MDLLYTVILPAILLVLCVLCVGFFAGAETAYLSITDIKMRQLLKNDREGKKKNTAIKRIAFLKKDVNKLLSLILIGINFVTSLASGLGATVAINLFGNAGSTYATVVMTFALTIFGEILPKTVAAAHPVGIASRHSRKLIILEYALMPIVWFFSKLTEGITAFIMLFMKETDNRLSEEELKSLIDVGENEGTLEHSEKQLLYNIFAFTDLQVHHIMRHRSKVRFVPIDATYDETVKIFAEARYSWLPVCDGSFDEVKGILYYKTLLLRGKFSSSEENEAYKRQYVVRHCMKSAYFVPETMGALELLQKFKKERMHFAVAVDETGVNSGIVTLHDILGAVFGSRINEFLGDTTEESPKSRITEVSSLDYIVPGEIRLSELNEVLHLDLHSDDYDTLAGWLMEQFDELPEEGQAMTSDGVIYLIDKVEERRIHSVRIKLSAEEEH